MFELPGAKRVRRDELLSRNSSSRSPSPAPEEAPPDVHRRLGELLNLDQILTSSIPEQSRTDKDEQEQQKHANEEEEQEFEFRLFSAPAPRASTATAAQSTGAQSGGGGTDGGKNKADGTGEKTQKLRIRLRSPSPGTRGLEDGRFVNPSRGWEYYFTTPKLLSGSEGKEDQSAALVRKKQFEDAAVSGSQMLSWAQVPWPGCDLAWRVTRLKRHQTKLPRPSAEELSAAAVCYVESLERTPKSRKKPGKKRRVQLRKRLTAAEKAKESEAEKRNRKNRERKIKRRQKAREMKAATGGEGVAVKVEDDAASSHDEDD
ncbi:hypothetical protein FE257_006104 [Aspergillus nanangensis]|uniref:Uncharacterized protein n=1 Tax=Aspergillus nanangensis TaxID=2582783 RepID=A0AAD4CR36_ASPNN|nr:hypothetical protein FE257_006104 [Aspergillus nanangensis]